MGKTKICKVHKKGLTPAKGEWFILPIKGIGLECTDCVDTLDFWLPMPLYIVGIFGMIYYAIFPIAPDIVIPQLILMGGILILFFMQGSTWRVLKRLFQKARGEPNSSHE